MPKPLFKILAGLLLAALLALGLGCPQNLVRVGPNPARLNLELTARVTAEQVREVWRRKPPQEPLWDVALLIKSPEGGLKAVPPAPGQLINGIPGRTIQVKPVFLMPPGDHRLTLVATCYVRDIYYDGMKSSTEFPEVRIFKKDLSVSVASGKTLHLAVSVGP